jgi:hypothetical protein
LEESDKMKKIIYILTSLMMLIAFTACDDDSEYKPPDQIATETQAEIMDCFLNGNQERIKEMLCARCKNLPDIDEQVKKAFEFIDGEIVSYNEDHWGSACGASERKDMGGHTSEIVTDKGTEYTIGYKAWLTNEENPDLVGVYLISVKNDTEFDKYDFSQMNQIEEEEVYKKHMIYIE